MIPVDYETLEEMRLERDAASAAAKDPRIAMPIRAKMAAEARDIGLQIIQFGAAIGSPATFDDRLEEAIDYWKEAIE